MKCILIVKVLLMMMITCCKPTTQPKELFVENDTYTLEIVDHCVQSEIISNNSSDYTRQNQCTLLWHLAHMVHNRDNWDVAYNYEYIADPQVKDVNFSYRIKFKQKFEDLVARKNGFISSVIDSLEDYYVLTHAQEFYNISVNPKRKEYPAYKVLVTNPTLLLEHLASPSGKNQGSTTSGSNYKIEVHNGSMYKLAEFANKIAKRPIVWKYDNKRYTFKVGLERNSEDPWKDLQDVLKKQFGIEFVEDVVELPYAEITKR